MKLKHLPNLTEENLSRALLWDCSAIFISILQFLCLLLLPEDDLRFGKSETEESRGEGDAGCDPEEDTPPVFAALRESLEGEVMQE